MPNTADIPSTDGSITLSSVMDTLSRQYPHVTSDDLWAIVAPTALVTGMAAGTGFSAGWTAVLGAATELASCRQTFLISDAATDANKESLKNLKDWSAIASLAGLSATTAALSLSQLFDTNSMVAVLPAMVGAQGAHVYFVARKRENTIAARSESAGYAMGDMPGGGGSMV